MQRNASFVRNTGYNYNVLLDQHAGLKAQLENLYIYNAVEQLPA